MHEYAHEHTCAHVHTYTCAHVRAHTHTHTHTQVIAVNLPIDEINGMREMFLDIDKDKSGNITIDEFAQALKKKGQIVTEQEIEKIMQVSR